MHIPKARPENHQRIICITHQAGRFQFADLFQALDRLLFIVSLISNLVPSMDL